MRRVFISPSAILESMANDGTIHKLLARFSSEDQLCVAMTTWHEVLRASTSSKQMAHDLTPHLPSFRNFPYNENVQREAIMLDVEYGRGKAIDIDTLASACVSAFDLKDVDHIFVTSIDFEVSYIDTYERRIRIMRI